MGVSLKCLLICFIVCSRNKHYLNYVAAGGAKHSPCKMQIGSGDTVAIYLPNHNNNEIGRSFAEAGIAEARRKGNIIGPIEVWFSDKTKITFN